MPTKTTTKTKQNDKIIQGVEKTAKKIADAKDAIAQVILGQENVVEQALVTLLAGGHGLLVGVPGLAKTKLVETLGKVMSISTNRVQFTPDLMPSDILGSEILDEDTKGKRHFRFLEGPIFTQLLMADEINRASPRTQSALLQAMQEYHVTIAGKRHDLPKPFHVLATQNPLEQEGTYPLPEAQLDRFLMQIDVDYPDLETEKNILVQTTGEKEPTAKACLSVTEFGKAQRLVTAMPVGESVLNAIVEITRAMRPDGNNKNAKHIEWGPGPRAGQALMKAVRARALIHKRLAPSVDDVIALAEPVLKHRMALNFTARAEGISITKLVSDAKTKIG